MSPCAIDAQALARDALLADLKRHRSNGAVRDTIERLLRTSRSQSGGRVGEACAEW